MPLTTAADLVDAIRRFGLLERARLKELPGLRDRFPDARILAGELIRRGWLTPYQANLLLQGRGQELVLGKYLLLERLGEGGMGQVFKARHQQLGRLAALKVIRQERLTNPGTVRRFQREVQAAAQLDHPNIVLAYDADQVGNTLFYAMEYVEGIDLGRLVKEHGPLPAAAACEYIRQAALGLQHAHEHGLVHRDIKPSNLLLARQGTGPGIIKILDMGLARLLQADPEEDPSGPLSQEGLILGTPDYIAPEQAIDSHLADIRSDLYSLGCSFYYLLTGRAPFRGSMVEKLLKHRLEEPTAVEQLRSDVPPAVIAVLRKLMAKRPEDRYQTPAEAADALAAAMSRGLAKGAPAPALLESAPSPLSPEAEKRGGIEEEALADTPASWESVVTALDKPLSNRLRRPSGRRRWLLPLAGVLLMAAAAGAVFLLRERPAEPDRPRPVVLQVAADQSWQDTYLDVAAGETIALGAVRGQWQKRGQPACSVKGLGAAPRDRAVLPEAPWMCLLARIGNDENLVPLGMTQTLRPAQGGRLFLCVNDFDRKENTGTIQVEIVGGTRQETAAPRPAPTWQERAEETVQGLAARAAGSPADRDRLRADLLDFGMRYPGTFQARRAADLLRRLPSPLDALDPAPAGDRPASGTPPELVAILGRLWGRHWWGHVESVIFIPGGRLLASAGDDQRIRLWDTATGRETAELQGHHTGVAALAVTAAGKMLAAGGKNGHVYLWKLPSPGGPFHSFNPNVGPVQSLAFSPDGRTLALGGTNGMVSLWDVAGRKETKRFTGLPDQVACVAFDPLGRTLAAAVRGQKGGKSGGGVRLWDLASGDMRSLREGDQEATWAVAFSPDGQTIVSGGTGGVVRFWDTWTGAARGELKAAGTILSLAFSPDGSRLAAADGDPTRPGQPGTACVWDVITGREIAVLRGHAALVRAVVFSPDGQALATAGYDQTARLWEAATGRELLAGTGHSRLVRSLAFSPDGKWAATAGAAGTTLLWDLAARAPRPLPAARAHGLAFSPDGKQLATAGADRIVRLWDTAGGKQQAVLKGHTSGVQAVAFAPDGRTLASAGLDATVRLWDMADGKEPIVLKGHTGGVQAVAFAPDGRTLATAGADRVVRLWDVASGKERAVLQGHTEPVNSVAYAPDGRALASAGADQTVRLWDAVTGKRIRTLEAHTKAIASVAFASDGLTLASAGDDGLVVWWSAITGKERKRWQLPGPTAGLAFAADGRHLAVGNGNGTTYILRLEQRGK